MSYSISRNGPTRWRLGATEAEIAHVAEIDEALTGIEETRAALTNERRLIINRATKRDIRIKAAQ